MLPAQSQLRQALRRTGQRLPLPPSTWTRSKQADQITVNLFAHSLPSPKVLAPVVTSSRRAMSLSLTLSSVAGMSWHGFQRHL